MSMEYTTYTHAEYATEDTSQGGPGRLEMGLVAAWPRCDSPHDRVHKAEAPQPQRKSLVTTFPVR